jgi:DNA-binding transcriptional MerR regulator
MNTKEFATLCGVEKRTLFHYDEIGLLKPSSIRENGYREYAPNQLFDMDMIKIFQACGYSLAEIKDMFAAPGDLRIDFMQDGKERIEAQIHTLTEMHRYLQSKQDFIKKYRELPIGTYEITDMSICYNEKKLEKLAGHYFTFLIDGTYSVLLFRDRCDVSTCQLAPDGEHTKKGRAITFFMKVPSSGAKIYERVSEQLKIFNFNGEDHYYVENTPHFLLASDDFALLKVIVFERR